MCICSRNSLALMPGYHIKIYEYTKDCFDYNSRLFNERTWKERFHFRGVSPTTPESSDNLRKGTRFPFNGTAGLIYSNGPLDRFHMF